MIWGPAGDLEQLMVNYRSHMLRVDITFSLTVGSPYFLQLNCLPLCHAVLKKNYYNDVQLEIEALRGKCGDWHHDGKY